MPDKFKKFDVAIIGGGFYGCMLALHFKNIFNDVVLLEKETDLLLKASYNNQARIHNGYHYPRSFITALRSHINYARFVSDFSSAVDDNFQMIYAIASNNSKTTTSQFIKFCQQIGSPLAPAPAKIKKLFDNRLIEDAFLVEEAVFNAAKLRDILKEKLISAKVKIKYSTEVTKVVSKDNGIHIHLGNGEKVFSSRVFNCSYSGINNILQNSNLPTLPFKYELTQMPLFEVPTELERIGITIMDGPFFSIMPFPDKKLHTLHHVRYTPLISSSGSFNMKPPEQTDVIYMIKDAQRYIPLLKDLKYKGSLYEVKTVLMINELSDARPILFKKDYRMDNFYVVMGGKIDNVYDILSRMEKIFKNT